MSKKQPKPIEIAISHFGSQANLARALNETPMTIHQWLRRNRIPLKHVVKIERVSGGAVTKEQLRPDVFGSEAA
jgi:DNA-binding transcriptional regulator YdaS (Cro superfamily)